jgi:uncharacterized membrane protein YhfC
MVVFANLLAILITVVGPFVLAIILIRKYRPGWWLVLVGIGTFIASQAIHIPLLEVIYPAYQQGKIIPLTSSFYYLGLSLLVGMLAGLCEEGSRWVGYRLVKAKGRSWGAALTLGAGHGGTECFIIGVVILANAITLLASNGGWQAVMPNLTQPFQVTSYMGVYWYDYLIGAIERIFALTTQLTLSVLVWQSVVKGAFRWWLAAFAWHTLVDGLAVFLQYGGVSTWGIEGVIGLFAVLGVVVMVWIRRNNPDPPAPLPEAVSAQ